MCRGGGASEAAFTLKKAEGTVSVRSGNLDGVYALTVYASKVVRCLELAVRPARIGSIAFAQSHLKQPPS